MKEWIRPEIQALSAYHVPDPGDWIKLDAMENPYHWPETLQQQWLESVKSVEINRYPDPSARELSVLLKQEMGVPDGHDIVLGNGSDELIQMLLLTVAGSGRSVMAPEPTFVMYRMIADFVGMDFVGVPLDDNFALDMEAMVVAIEQHQPAVIFLAYPNNPTGNLWKREDIKKILQIAPGFVVVDEAYHVFAEESFMGLLPEYENLLVMRTVSKMGLAGLRLGLMAGSPQWIGEVNKVRLPYNINVLTQHAATFILQHASVLHDQAEQLRDDRETMFNALKKITGIEQVYPSQANFILFKVCCGRADKLFEGIKSRGVLIKNMSPAGGSLTDCLRVTVGTAADNSRFIGAVTAELSTG